MFEGHLDPLRSIDLALLQPLPQVLLRSQVHVHHLIGLGEDAVRKTFPNL